MDTVTYSQNDVAEFIEQFMFSVRVPSDHKPLADDYDVKWTPLTVMLDKSGKEIKRTLGFLSPDDLKASVMMAAATQDFQADQFDSALLKLDKIINEFPRSTEVAEAIFMQGVCRYKSTHDPQPLKEVYEQLRAQYPENEWARRAYPYRLI